MANALYPLARQAFSAKGIGWTADTIKVMLVKTAQAYNAAHQYVSDLTGSNIIARSSGLGTKTDNLGTLDAADITFTTPTTGNSCNLIIYKDTGSDATSALILFLDTGTGLPVTTNGGDIAIEWASGSDKIMTL